MERAAPVYPSLLLLCGCRELIRREWAAAAAASEITYCAAAGGRAERRGSDGSDRKSEERIVRRAGPTSSGASIRSINRLLLVIYANALLSAIRGALLIDSEPRTD